MLIAVSKGAGSERHLRPVVLAIAILASVALAGYLAYAYATGSPGSGGSGLMGATCSSVANQSGPVEHVVNGGSGPHVYFLIVEADPSSPFAGLNGSYYAGTNTTWPVITVHVGDMVSIHVINCQSHEPHGFAISYYDDNSLTAIQPGQSYNVTFTASKSGEFRIYCDIFCAIHPFMQNGELVVS